MEQLNPIGVTRDRAFVPLPPDRPAVNPGP
jgi:hypothetical protein